MRISYDHDVDALYFEQSAGKYAETLPYRIGDVELNIDVSSDGKVIGLEVLGATGLLGLIGKQGGMLALPERITDPDTFAVDALFGERRKADRATYR